jgi:tight adherence protein C
MIFLIYALVFISAGGVAYYFLGRGISRSTRDRIEYALPARLHETPSWFERVLSLLVSVLDKLSPLAADPRQSTTPDISPLKLKLIRAGFQSIRASWLFLGAKVLLAFLSLTLALTALFVFNRFAVSSMVLLMLLLCFSLGFYLPDFVLSRLTVRRQQLIFNAFPDVLDLMRMCVQSGLGLDQSLDRVGKEIGLTCRPLSDELEMTGLELRAGVSRSDALRNLSSRIGLSDVDTFVVTLIQSDRFGNSVSDALAIYADALRSKRRIASEELAAKLPIKLMIPLIFCIFPSLLTVLLGPAIVHIHNRLVPILSN